MLWWLHMIRSDQTRCIDTLSHKMWLHVVASFVSVTKFTDKIASVNLKCKLKRSLAKMQSPGFSILRYYGTRFWVYWMNRLDWQAMTFGISPSTYYEVIKLTLSYRSKVMNIANLLTIYTTILLLILDSQLWNQILSLLCNSKQPCYQALPQQLDYFNPAAAGPPRHPPAAGGI